MSICRLSVNINKIALIRNSRGSNYPNLTAIAQDCERYGAQGITVHPRPDERHVKFADLSPLKEVVKTEFNIEGYPSPMFISMVKAIKPAQVTLVPDNETQLTSDHGWDTVKTSAFLKPIISDFKSMGIRVSIFLNADPSLIDSAVETGTDSIELYTGPYALAYSQNRESAIAPYIKTAELASKMGLGVNAGHDLNLENLAYFKQQIPSLSEVSIGHALICDSLYYGLENTIQMYLHKLS